MDQFLKRQQLSEHFSIVEHNGVTKARCKLTGHESANEKALAQFKTALACHNYDFSQHEPYIVAHSRDPKKMFCLVTRQTLNRIPKEIDRHVAGKRYTRGKAHIEANGGLDAFYETRGGNDDDDEASGSAASVLLDGEEMLDFAALVEPDEPSDEPADEPTDDAAPSKRKRQRNGAAGRKKAKKGAV